MKLKEAIEKYGDKVQPYLNDMFIFNCFDGDDKEGWLKVFMTDKKGKVKMSLKGDKQFASYYELRGKVEFRIKGLKS